MKIYISQVKNWFHAQVNIETFLFTAKLRIFFISIAETNKASNFKTEALMNFESQREWWIPFVSKWKLFFHLRFKFDFNKNLKAF